MKVLINRAPVLTLWAAIVAERMGFEPEEALSLGRCLAGLNAQSKGRTLGVYQRDELTGPVPKIGLGEEFWIELCGRPVPAKKTEDGIRAVKKDQPVDPAKAQTYLESKFGDDLVVTQRAMAELAAAYGRQEISSHAYELYTRFRPEIPKGRAGWGAKGELDLETVRSLKPD